MNFSYLPDNFPNIRMWKRMLFWVLCFLFLISFLFISPFSAKTILAQIPPPIPGNPSPEPYVPCDEVRPDSLHPLEIEFHSLRPYQVSPCNQNAENLALFCGNDFTILDQIDILKEYTDETGTLEWEYIFEGEEIPPTDPQVPNFRLACSYCSNGQCLPRNPPCIPDEEINCSSDLDCQTECVDNGDGTETCVFTIDRIKDIAIDLEGAYLPIMGFTEPSSGATSQTYRVINSVYQGDETMNNPDRVNEYVSWYLNGIIGRAEYDPPETNLETGREQIVDFSGPIKKLLAFENQISDRIQEVQRVLTGEARHDQIIGCVNSLGQPTHCYPDRAGVTETRLSYWTNRFPPLRSAFDTFEDYIDAYENWRNNTRWRLFTYIPFSSTEDRIGMVELASYTVHPPISGTVVILSSQILSQDPAELFFSHMEEGFELGNIPRQIFNPRGYGN